MSADSKGVGKGACTLAPALVWVKGKGKGRGPPPPVSQSAGGGKGAKGLHEKFAEKFMEFVVDVEKRQPIHGYADRHWSHCLDTRIGLGCAGGNCAPKEIQVVLPGFPLAGWNSTHAAADRIRAGDILWAVDGKEVAPLHDWRTAIDRSSPVATLTVRRLHEVRKVIQLAEYDDAVVGLLLSGEHVFRLSASVLAATANHLREAVSNALSAPPETIQIFHNGRRLEDSDTVRGLSGLIVQQIGKARPWTWKPPAKSEEIENDVTAEALPVEYSCIHFQQSVDNVREIIERVWAVRSAAMEDSPDDGNRAYDTGAWTKSDTGRWKYELQVEFDLDDLAAAEALPVDTSPLRTVAANIHHLAAIGGSVLFANDAGQRASDASEVDIVLDDVHAEAAAWLRAATLASLDLAGLEALMLEGCVSPECAATATCDLLEALVKAQRWDDVVLYADAVLCEKWRDGGRVKQTFKQNRHPHQKEKRRKLRNNLGERSAGFEVPAFPLGRGLPMLQTDIMQMYRFALLAIVQAARSGNAASLVVVARLSDSFDSANADAYLARATIDLAGTLLPVMPDDHKALVPTLLKFIRFDRSAYSALRRLASLDHMIPDADVASGLRGLILKLCPPASKSFALMLEKGEAWISHPKVIGEADRRGCTVEELAPLLNVEMVDACGYPLADDASAGRFIRVNIPTASLQQLTPGSWEHLAPFLVKVLRRLGQSPTLLHDNDVLTALCAASSTGFSESRRLAFEALAILAPCGHGDTLRAACRGSVAEDVAVRAQAIELLSMLARPEDIAFLQSELAAKRDVYSAFPMRLLAQSSL